MIVDNLELLSESSFQLNFTGYGDLPKGNLPLGGPFTGPNGSKTKAITNESLVVANEEPKIHEGKKHFQCNHCNKKFTSKFNFTRFLSFFGIFLRFLNDFL